MRETRIFLATPTIHGEEQAFVQEAFDTNWVAPLGKNVDGLEAELASYVGIGHAAALTSGTAALHLAVKLAGVGRDDVVLCSDFTFSATVNPVSYEGGRQVFVDSERDSWNMDPRALELALQKYPQAKAVIFVHLYGTPGKIEEIARICATHGVTLIEDAAESLGATVGGRQTGTYGAYNAFSFNGNKIITTSGGGMLVSEDGEAVQKARFWATQAREPAPHYQHEEIGYNYRMSNVVAGIGRGQMLHLEEHIAAKKAIYQRYQEGFRDIPVTMNPYLEGTEPNFWLSCFTVDEGCAVKPYDIMDMLAADNIEGRPIWKPMHLQPVFAGHDFITLEEGSVGEDIFTRGLCLPSDIKMTPQEQDEIIAMIRALF